MRNNKTKSIGKHKVTKVCNTYCGSCAKAHSELERLVEEGSIDKQIIFFPNDSMDDLQAKTIIHLLAINSKGDYMVTQEALDMWYTAEEKDYSVFAEPYPINGELD